MTVVTSSNYWNVLFTEIQNEVEENGRMKYLLIEKKYKQAVERAEERIRFFYGKNAVNNRIPLKLAYRKLDKEQLDQFYDLIEQYIKWWDKPIDHAEKVSLKDTTSESDVSEAYELNDTEAWITYLRECKNRDDITYFEALSIPILNEVEKVSHDTANTLLELLVITGWTVHSDIAKNLKIQELTQEQLKKELLKSWASDGMSLTERFSRNKNMLTSSVKASLIKGFRNEMTVDEVIADVSRTMGIGQNAAKRLVLTENTHFSTHSTYLALKQAGYTHYRYMCRLLPTSCEDCIDLHNTVFPIEMYEVGVTASPMHPHCLCYIIGEDN